MSTDNYKSIVKDVIRLTSTVVEHVDAAIGNVYLAEDRLDPGRRKEYEEQFAKAFETAAGS